MSLDYAVDRLYSTGWSPNPMRDRDPDAPDETLADGRRFPSMQSIQREFAARGLKLSMHHQPKFSCYKASWSPADGSIDIEGDARGTVVGLSDREAAVYALAQLREADELQTILENAPRA